MIALLQPIEIHAGKRRMTVTVGAVGPTLITLTSGSYACILTLLREIQSHLDAGGLFLRPHLGTGDADGFIIFSTPAGVGDLTVEFTDPALGRLLGFRSDIGPEPAPAAVVSSDPPQRCLFPGIVASERHRWHRDHDRAFSGSQAQDGTCSGVEQGPAVYTRRLVWDDVRARAALEEGCVDSFDWGGVTYYPEQERAWEAFIISAQASTLVDATQTGITGCFYVPEISVYQTDDPHTVPFEYPHDMGQGGIRHNLTVSPDLYCFANLAADPPPPASESLDGSVEYYRIEAELFTAPAPGWYVPDAAPVLHAVLTHSDVVPRTAAVSLACPGGNAVRVHWGDGTYEDLVCDGLLKNLSKAHAAGTWQISLSGDWRELTQFRAINQAWISGDLAAF
jgi:hypothetical protein